MSRRLRLLAWSLVVVGLLLAIATVLFALLDPGGMADSDGVLDVVALALPGASFFAVGALLALRRAGNGVGWLCLTIGLVWLLFGAQNRVAAWAFNTGHIELGAWLGTGLSNWWVLAVGLMGTHLPLRLPDGAHLSPRWRWYSWFCTAVIVLAYVVIVTEPSGGGASGSENPFAVEWLEPLFPVFFLLPLSFLGAIASLVIRYRRADGVQLQQLRWIAFGGLVFVAEYVVALVILVGFSFAEDGLAADLLTYLTFAAYAAIPCAIGVAILRYRLYDLGVVLNRALVYGALTATLAAAYVGSVLLLQLALSRVSGGSDLAVAGSTLAVAAM
ncbi:MAG: hypothetical protein M3Q84_04865, partial [Actinomycetota bacterium]|nr:hypothetical protein [Actinomycetota bacterium]